MVRHTRIKYIFSVVVFIGCGIIAILHVRAANQTTTSSHRREQDNEEALVEKHVQQIEGNYVCYLARRSNGLGNQMFHFASAYGISRTKNLTLFIGTGDVINTGFDHNVEIRNDRTAVYKCTTFRSKGQDKCCIYDESILDFQPGENIQLFGFLQSFKYFHHVRDEIRQQFTFKSHIRREADKVLTRIRTGFEASLMDRVTMIGIHVRMGNMLGKVSVAGGNKVATKAYMEKATTYFASKFPNCVFVVCGQNETWARSAIPSKYRAVYLQENPVREVDMAIVSGCDHVVMTTGTFGWWCAYLNKGEVTYYDECIADGSKRSETIRYEDYFLGEWIPLH